MRKLSSIAFTVILVSVSSASMADSGGTGYLAGELLSPCQNADNDARWGEAAETECEQYILGFVDGMHQAGATGKAGGVCPPDVNTADEVRWAFMRWVHEDYSKRTAMLAADALTATLKESFTCK